MPFFGYSSEYQIIGTNIEGGQSSLATNGSYNIALGNFTLGKLVNGSNNIAVGYQALYNDTTGGDNLAIGYQAARLLTTGSSNMALGTQAMGFGTVTGQGNLALGFQTAGSLTSGLYNTFVGYGAAGSVNAGSYNVCVGYLAGGALVAGSNNTIIGQSAGSFRATGSNNIIIGNGVDVDVAGSSNNIIIGDATATTIKIGGNKFTPSFGTKSYTIGANADYPDIQTAITALGSRITNRTSQNTVVTATNGNPTVTLGTWPAGNVLRIGDLWKADANSRYYKIKALNSTAKTITLWENYANASIAGVATAWSTFYLDRITLIIQPGNLTSNAAVLQPGFDIVGVNTYGSAMGETQGGNPYPLTNFGENNLQGVSFAPVPGWGDMDKMVGTVNPNLWGGADSFVEKCYIVDADLNGIHSGGQLNYPVQNAGKITYRSCVFRCSRSPVSVSGGAVTPTVANTTVNFDNCRYEGIIDTESQKGSELYPGAICADAIATYNFMTPNVDVPDRGMPSFVGNAFGILVGNPTGGAGLGVGTVNIHGPFVRVANTGTLNANGIEVTGAATVNIDGADVEAAGTTSTGLYVNNAGATVNIRGGCRFKGGTNSINNVAGTVNKSTSQPPILIGATAGVITALDT